MLGFLLSRKEGVKALIIASVLLVILEYRVWSGR